MMAYFTPCKKCNKETYTMKEGCTVTCLSCCEDNDETLQEKATTAAQAVIDMHNDKLHSVDNIPDSISLEKITHDIENVTKFVVRPIESLQRYVDDESEMLWELLNSIVLLEKRVDFWKNYNCKMKLVKEEE